MTEIGCCEFEIVRIVGVRFTTNTYVFVAPYVGENDTFVPLYYEVPERDPISDHPD